MSEDMEVACLLCLSDDKSFPETFWAICQMTNRPQRRFGTSGPSTLRKMTIWAHLHSGVFAWKGIFMDCHADARNDGWKSPSALPCPLLEFYKFPQSFGQLPIRGAKSVRILFGRLAGRKIMDCHADARNDGCEVTGLPLFARNDGCEVTGLPLFARNDGYEVTGLPRWRSQWRAWYMSLQKFFYQNCFWRQFVKSFFPCLRIKDCICGAKRYG